MIFLLIFMAAIVVFGLSPVVAVMLARAWWREGRRGRAGVAASAAVVLVGIAIEAFVIEPHALEVSRVEIRDARIQAPLRIAVVADIQTDAPGAYEASVLQAVAEAQPDLVVFPGDFVQVAGPAYAAQTDALRGLLQAAKLEPKLGAYAVAGNVEVIHDDWPRMFRDTGIEAWKTRTRVDLGPVVLTGLPLHQSFAPDMRLDPEDAFHIVFGHAPDFSLGQTHADLMIAGHTHGGQVRLPFIGPLITFSSVPRAHAAGHTVLENGSHLVVSRGIGMERGPAPRMRFLCRPELALIDLLPAD